jgi:hypothetical protein
MQFKMSDIGLLPSIWIRKGWMGGGQIDSLYRAGIDVENAFSNVSLLFQSVPMIHTTTSSSYSYGTIPIIQTETAGLISRRRNSMEFIKKYSRLSSVVFCVVIVFFGTTRHTQDKATTSSPENAYGSSRGRQSSKLKEHEDHHILNKMREEFNVWVKEHGREYAEEEKDRRFHIWTQNHLR